MAKNLKSNQPPGLQSRHDFCRGIEMLLGEIKWYLHLKPFQRYEENKKRIDKK